ncbi:MAG: hypothetical protein KA714_13300 [Limnoraphis sp. WC205]|jgi:hypothetical protein|nr:hypothetical protein [Limnoraphis sp. WC205]
MSTKSPTLYLGSFNSEQFWRPKRLSKLPAIADLQADTIVSVMDELGFVFCDSPDDLLITRLPIDETHKQYLRELGFSFLNNELPLMREEADLSKSLEKLLVETENYEHFKKLISSLSDFSPYSILPLTDSFCKNYQLQNPYPDIEGVEKVNSKLFSHQLSKKLFEDTVGEPIYSAEELERKGDQFLQHSSFLIKDEFGVSGKGNVLVSSPQILTRIVKYIAKQESTGQQTRFLLEPFLEKQIDFSCQFEIGSKGQVNIRSIQKMQNAGFAFSGIQTAEADFQAQLDQLGYFAQVEAIAAALDQEGYFGPVCLDSMLLKDGKIVPVVEINARKSMGLINYYVDRFLSQFSRQGCLMFFSLGLTYPVTFSEILDKMRQENILFLRDKPHGILPLSSRTLDINWKFYKDINYKTYKGRLYVSLVSDDEDSKALILDKMNKIFADLKIQKFN